MSVRTIFKVKIYPHPSKRKAGTTNETLSVPGYGQDAAYAADKHYRDAGHPRVSKVLHGFEIDGKEVEADITSALNQSRNETHKSR